MLALMLTVCRLELTGDAQETEVEELPSSPHGGVPRLHPATPLQEGQQEVELEFDGK